MSQTYSLADEASLWQMLRQGDGMAFEVLYRRNVTDLLRYGERMGLPQEALKDLVQDLFVEIWRSQSRLKPTDSVKFYLFRALRYKIIRYQHRHQLTSLPQHMAEPEASAEDRILLAEQEKQTAKQLRQAISRLPKRQQEIIHLRFYQGFTNAEIAALMSLQYQSAANLVYRSLQSIRQFLREPALPLAWVLIALWA